MLSEVLPEVLSEVLPEVLSEVLPDVLPEVLSEALPEVAEEEDEVPEDVVLEDAVQEDEPELLLEGAGRSVQIVETVMHNPITISTGQGFVKDRSLINS